MVLPLRRHASHVSQEVTLNRRDPASAHHVPLVVLVLITEYSSTFHALSVGITALQIRPRVWHALAENTDHMREQPYAWIVRLEPFKIPQVP